MDDTSQFTALEHIARTITITASGSTPLAARHSYFDFARMQKDSLITIFTEYNTYNFTVLEPVRGHAIVEGSELFTKPTPVLLDGSVCEGTLIHGRVQLGLPLKLTYSEGELMTDPVKRYSVFYKSEIPIFTSGA